MDAVSGASATTVARLIAQQARLHGDRIAIDDGARSIDDIRRRTRAATGPCGSKRCGPVVRRMLRDA